MTTRNSNRRASVPFFLCWLAGLTACGGGGGSGDGDTVKFSDKRPDGSKLSADDRAAADFVTSRLGEHWVKGADGWTTQFQLRNYFGEVLPGTPDMPFQQYRNLEFTIEPEELTESQRLNGADYRGVAEFQNAPVRYFRTVATFEGPEGWSDWSEGTLLFRRLAVERRNGKWLIQDDDLFVGIKPDPSTIPSSR